MPPNVYNKGESDVSVLNWLGWYGLIGFLFVPNVQISSYKLSNGLDIFSRLFSLTCVLNILYYGRYFPLAQYIRKRMGPTWAFKLVHLRFYPLHAAVK